MPSANHVQFMKLIFSQAVTVTGVAAAGFEPTNHLQNIISFDCMYGFDRLKSRKNALWVTIFTRLDPLKPSTYSKTVMIVLMFYSWSDIMYW